MFARHTPIRSSVALAAILALPEPLLAAAPQAASFSGDYTVSFLGITIARSTFSSAFNGDRFKVDGSLTAAGLAQLFDDTHGTTTVSGRFAGNQPRPDRFRADYVSGSKAKRLGMRFSGGRVVETTVVPPPRKRGADWLPLKPGDLARTNDPLSATLVRAASLDEVCTRSSRVYDGELRVDLQLSPHSSGDISVPGYSGPIVTCTVKFVPVSGYRKGRRALDYLKNRSRITVSFAPLGSTGVYAPIRASIGTQIGTLAISANRFEALD